MRITVTLLMFILPILSWGQSNFNHKVSLSLQEEIQAQPDTYHHIFITLSEQLDADKWQQRMRAKNTNKEVLYASLLQELQAIANATQPALLEQLYEIEQLQHESIVPLWITNVIQVKAKANAIIAMSKLEQIQRLEPVGKTILFDVETSAETAPPNPNGTEQGVRVINAPAMWALGYTGYGTKLLVIDSGVTEGHIALRSNYWGYNVPTREAWTGIGRPSTCVDHGTAVAGVALGIDRMNNDTVGVAPNAKWMAGPIDFGECVIESGSLTQAQIFQWAVNPDNDLETMDDRPDVINNSWGSGNVSCDQVYLSVMVQLELLDIAVVWAAGNSGDDPRSVIGTQNLGITLVNTFTVGNLNGTSLAISEDSSRGPSACPGSGSLAIKPEVSAPGIEIRTTARDGGYLPISGTSFSAPHVAGALLLLREAFPDLSSEDLKLALYFSARDLGPEGEDNAYGMGLIDVLAAYEYLINEGHIPAEPISTTNDAAIVNISTERPVNCFGAVDVMLSIENAGRGNIQSLDVAYYLNGNEAETSVFNWTGNLGENQTQTFALTTLEDLPAGEHELSVTISNPNGQIEARLLNNVMQHFITIVDLEYIEPSLAAQYETPVCLGSQVALQSVRPLADNQQLLWYDSPEPGAIFNLGKLGEGNPYITDALTENTTFYADLLTTNKVGRSEPGDNPAASATELGIEFDVLSPLRLASVTVFAEEGGARRVMILDELGNTKFNRIFNLDAGKNILQLSLDMEEGKGYSIVGVPLGNQRRLRIANSATFPYEVPGVIRLTRSTGTALRYFYFFDFEVETLHACGRTAITVDVNQNSNAPGVGFTVSAEEVTISEGGIVEFTTTASSSLEQYWDFGDGTQSTENNPSHTYTQVGEYVVTHTITDADDCSSSAQKTITVTENPISSTQDVREEDLVDIFPNPSSDFVVVQTRRAQRIEVELSDVFGKRMRVNMQRPNASGMRIDTKSLASGIYYILIYLDGKTIVKKLVKTGN